MAAVAVLTVATGCLKSPELDPDLTSGPLLRLSTGSSFTRSDDHYGDDLYAETNGEEAINRVDLFFFENEEDEKTAFYTHGIHNLTDVTIADLEVKIPVELINKFVDKKAYIYALVNLPDDVVVSADANKIDGKPATLDQLRQQWVASPEFAGGSTSGPTVPGRFVMRGGAQVVLAGENQFATVTGEIMLERLASKIRLWAQIPGYILVNKATGRTITDEDYEQMTDEAKTNVERWIPRPYESDGSSNILLYMRNINTKGRIDAYLGSSYEERGIVMAYDDVINRSDKAKYARPVVTKDKGLLLRRDDESTDYPYSHTVAYYSYPNKWDSSTPTEMYQPYLILSMPWYMEGESEQFQRCYYQIPVNAIISTGSGSNPKPANQLDPNTYYRIKIRLGMLGSKDLGEPTKVEDASWEAVPWNGAYVDVNIRNRRYLVVNQKEWVMNNDYSLEIPFSTSHTTTITACYVNYFRYNDNWGTDANSDPNLGTNPNHNKTEFKAWLDAAHVKFKDGGDYGENGEYGEGLLEHVDFDGKTDNELYYKKDYFYDPIYYDKSKASGTSQEPYRGFRYYVGHEHPKMFQRSAIKYNETALSDFTYTDTDGKLKTMTKQEQIDNWALYNGDERFRDINAVYTYKIDPERNVIIFTHPLVQWREVRDNAGKVKYYVPLLNPHVAKKKLWEEFSRCEIIIKIKHADYDKDDGLFEETIYITQYPAMYVEVSHDYGSPSYTEETVTGQNRKTVYRGNEYVSVNGNEIQETFGWTGTRWHQVTSTVSYFGEVNNNPNMYVIHTTQLSEENGTYILGDPRALYYNNDLSKSVNLDSSKDTGMPDNNRWSSRVRTTNNWGEYTGYATESITVKNARRLAENGTGVLKYYYPTDESVGPGSKENFIAPSFRIASSFGKVSLTYGYGQTDNPHSELKGYSRAEARRRCALYQEAGRPAGRWRVPTLAEIEYLLELSADGKIPHLFGSVDTSYKDYVPYWSANGLVGVNLNKSPQEGRITVYRNNDGTPNGEPEMDVPTDPAVRCVYDEWYWTQINERLGYTPDPVETEFLWGDVPKDNTQNEPLADDATVQP